MTIEIIREIFLPFLGTTAGAGCVFFLKGAMPRPFERALTGFAAGVMVAASIWSLIISFCIKGRIFSYIQPVRFHIGISGDILFHHCCRILSADKILRFNIAFH